MEFKCHQYINLALLRWVFAPLQGCASQAGILSLAERVAWPFVCVCVCVRVLFLCLNYLTESLLSLVWQQLVNH